MPAWALALLIFVVATGGLLAVMRQSFAARLRGLRHAVLSAPPPRDPSETDAPPEIVALARRLAPGAPARHVRFVQTCELRAAPDAPWRRMRAEQIVATGAPAFVWEARGGRPPARVVDALAGGVALLEARVLSTFPAMRLEGPEIARAELMRWLAELPLAPDALLGAAGLRWRVAEAGRLEVSVEAPGETPDDPVAVTLVLDAAGDVMAAEAPDRPRAVGGALVPTPWRGRFFDHAEVAGRRIPMRAEAEWLPPEGAFVYWRGRIESWAPMAPEDGAAPEEAWLQGPAR